MRLEKEVIKYKNGNKRSFDYIYNDTVGLVRFAIYQSIPNKYIVEDLIQDVYTKVDKIIVNYQESNFKAWIYRIAKNMTIDYLKKKKECLTESIDFLISEKSTHPYLYYAIRHLNDVEREIFLMKVLCGHTTKKITKILCLTPNVVNDIYYQTKEKLKKALEDFENETI